jgi:two-component system phosphate regulon sensor histidine kinase PhoR
LFVPLFAVAWASIFATQVGGLLAGVAAALFGAAIAAIVLSHNRTQSVAEIVAAARRIASGDFEHRIYAGSRGELAPLTRAMNEMSEQLAVRTARLTAESEQLRTILGGMIEGVIAIDGDQRVIFVNERATRLLDLQPPVAGRGLYEIVRHRTLQDVAKRALAESALCRAELTLTGSPALSLTVHAARLPGPPGRGAVLVLHDTSELRRLERIRQEFVANVSHELKTPLSVISACVETLQSGAKDDAEPRDMFLGRIAEQGERLHTLILDLLSLARIESGDELFEYEAVPVGDLAAACVVRHRSRAESQGLTLDSAGDASCRAWADGEAVREILDNLVDNALKYTPAGGRVAVRWRDDGEQAIIEVEDSGVGIPAADLPRIFERFYRVDKARSRELGGTGLGLAIVKHLAQAMNGQVAAVSQVNVGSTFTVRLPRPSGQSSPTLHTR